MVMFMFSPLHWLSERLEPTFQPNSELLHGPLKLYDTILSFLFLNLKNLYIKFSYYKCHTYIVRKFRKIHTWIKKKIQIMI